MTTRRLVVMAATLEMTAGSALIASPSVFVHLLLGASVSSGGIAVGRVGGIRPSVSWPGMLAYRGDPNRAGCFGHVYLQRARSALFRLSPCGRRLHRLSAMASMRSSCLAGTSAGVSSLSGGSARMAWRAVPRGHDANRQRDRFPLGREGRRSAAGNSWEFAVAGERLKEPSTRRLRLSISFA